MNSVQDKGGSGEVNSQPITVSIEPGQAGEVSQLGDKVMKSRDSVEEERVGSEENVLVEGTDRLRNWKR